MWRKFMDKSLGSYHSNSLGVSFLSLLLSGLITKGKEDMLIFKSLVTSCSLRITQSTPQ